MSGNNTDARVQIGTSFPGMTFPDEVQDGSTLGSACYKEFQHLYAQLEGFLRAAGFNADGTFNNLVSQSITLVNNYNTSLPPTVGNTQTAGTIYTVSAGGVATQVGGPQCCPDVAGVGTLLFTSYGNEGAWKFYTPQGVPLPDAPTVTGDVVSIRAVADGSVLVWGDASVGGIKIWDSTFTTFQNNGGSNDTAYGIGIDSSGNLYGKSSSNKIRKYTSNGTYVTEYTIPNCDNIKSVAVNPAGTVLYYSKTHVAAPVATLKEVYKYTIATTTEATFATDALYECDFNSILVRSNGDVLIAWNGGGLVGDIEHYNSSGVLLYTYTPIVNGSGVAPNYLTPGLTDFTFWAGCGANVSTFSGTVALEIQMGTGTVLNTLALDDANFYFGDTFCVLRAAIPNPLV